MGVVVGRPSHGARRALLRLPRSLSYRDAARNDGRGDAPEQQGARELENDREQDGVPELKSFGANGRGERIGDIVGT